MEINEITSEANADTYIAKYIRGARVGDNLLESLEEKVEDWTDEFDSIRSEAKARKSEDMNHYKLNMVIGLYFLIPVALFYIKNWKEITVDADVPVGGIDIDATLSQDLWDDEDMNTDDFFPSDPE